MDGFAWLATAVVVLIAAVGLAMAPRLRRDNLRRQLEGGGGALSGIGSGFDAVWRPSADEARADWEAGVEMPAPAPAPGDPVPLRDGRIVIDVED
jgi:hypothetical protein